MRFNDLKLAFIFLVIGSLIILKSYFNPDGYISPDSAKYLQLAQNLSDGRGMYITDLSNLQGKTFFAMWPFGYPFMIFIFAKLTTLSVFWASKLLNIFFIALTLLMFRKLFKEQAFWFALIFFVSSVNETFTYTWSEAPFIFGLVWFSMSVYNYSNDDSKFLPALNILLASLFLFFCRYVGIFSFGVIAVISVYYLVNRNYKSFGAFATILIILIFLAGSYLFINNINNGFATGGIRLHIHDSYYVLIKRLLLSQFREFIFLKSDNLYKYYVFAFALVAESAMLVYLYIKVKSEERKAKRDAPTNQIWKLFLFVGFSYWITLIVTRFILQFDPIDFRMLCPSTFMFIMAFISWLLSKTDRKSSDFRVRSSQHAARSTFFVFSVIILLSVYLIPNKSYLYNYYILKNISAGNNVVNYKTNMKNIEDKYSWIPSNSLVLMGNKHINYLRNDITVSNQLFGENMNEFVKRSMKNASAQNIYIEIQPNLNKKNNDETIRKYMFDHKGIDFIKLK